MKIICVAEKPSLSKSISQILSGGRCHTENTQNKYIKNYKFNCNYNTRQCDVTMTALLGHLMEIEFGPENSHWNQLTIGRLFTANITKRVKPDLKKLESNLKTLARNADMLVIWTDCDREGENIGSEVAVVCQSVNSRLVIKRAQFSVVQHREIMQAWNNLRELDWNAVAAVDARSELDLRIGAAFTRYQTMNLKPRFAELQEQKVLSYGPCQFPTLGFVVDRFLKAKNFREEMFWYINCSLTKDGSSTSFNWERGHLFDHLATLALYEHCLENPEASVISVVNKPTSKWCIN